MIKPTDLVGLTEREGDFPLDPVITRTDGQDPFVRHGSPMPVYGPFFERLVQKVGLPDGREMQTGLILLDIVAYLQAHQR